MANERCVETGRIVSQSRITGVSSFWQQRRSDLPLRRKPALMNTTSLSKVCYFYLSGVYRCISVESVSEIQTAASCLHNVKFSSTELYVCVCVCMYIFQALVSRFPTSVCNFPLAVLSCFLSSSADWCLTIREIACRSESCQKLCLLSLGLVHIFWPSAQCNARRHCRTELQHTWLTDFKTVWRYSTITFPMFCKLALLANVVIEIFPFVKVKKNKEIFLLLLLTFVFVSCLFVLRYIRNVWLLNVYH